MKTQHSFHLWRLWQFWYPSNPKQWKSKGRATPDQTVCWLTWPICVAIYASLCRQQTFLLS